MEKVAEQLAVQFNNIKIEIIEFYDGVVQGLFELAIDSKVVPLYLTLVYHEQHTLKRLYCVLPLPKAEFDRMHSLLQLAIKSEEDSEPWETLSRSISEVREAQNGQTVLLHLDWYMTVEKCVVVEWGAIKDNIPNVTTEGNVIENVLEPENLGFWKRRCF